MKPKINIVPTIIKGLLFVVLGVLILRAPLTALSTFILYLGIAIGCRGLYLVYTALKYKEGNSRISWQLFNGLFDLIFALILWVYPEITLELLPFMVGIWAITGGLLESAIAINSNISKSWPHFLFSIILLIYGWIILMHPLYSDIFFTSLLGGLLIFIGVGYIIVSLMLRKLFR